MLQKDIYLDNLEAGDFYLSFEKNKTLDISTTNFRKVFYNLDYKTTAPCSSIFIVLISDLIF